jgi:hypothetical protein
MNPTNYEQPGLSLPEPLGSEVATKVNDETIVVSSEMSPTSPGQLMPNPLPKAVPPLNDAVSPQAVPPTAPTALAMTTPSMADDADLIEKEWVSKAKAIVERTKDDPRQQSQEINYFKADYLKKRYNKDVKVSES